MTSCHRLLIGPFLLNELTLSCAVIWGHFTWGQPPSWLVRLFVWSKKGSWVWPQEPLTFLACIWGDVGNDKTSGLSTCMLVFFLHRLLGCLAFYPHANRFLITFSRKKLRFWGKKSRKWHFTVTVCTGNLGFLACPCCLTASYPPTHVDKALSCWAVMGAENLPPEYRGGV